MTITFNLYSSEGCHLCEQALQLCQQAKLEPSLQVVDIVEHEHLAEQYGVHIPVLERLSDGQKLFWPFTQQQIEELMH
ncbi:glutaredoxin family protein [Thalassotalea sp. G2M2-11]|uniref:glutaredoxin family protein n=1 Tax=Thalassotalea sp. G2M2-11 TaxID=2787627 RepID=UPI0019CF4D62|nr:glutaredoxin family protein [Thalassotalea sp. G2M2-11]